MNDGQSMHNKLEGPKQTEKFTEGDIQQDTSNAANIKRNFAD